MVLLVVSVFFFPGYSDVAFSNCSAHVHYIDLMFMLAGEGICYPNILI